MHALSVTPARLLELFHTR